MNLIFHKHPTHHSMLPVFFVCKIGLSMKNYLVFFHLSPSGTAGQNQFADSIVTETTALQTFLHLHHGENFAPSIILNVFLSFFYVQ